MAHRVCERWEKQGLALKPALACKNLIRPPDIAKGNLAVDTLLVIRDPYICILIGPVEAWNGNGQGDIAQNFHNRSTLIEVAARVARQSELGACLGFQDAS